jgi:hypothetical protein
MKTITPREGLDRSLRGRIANPIFCRPSAGRPLTAGTKILPHRKGRSAPMSQRRSSGRDEELAGSGVSRVVNHEPVMDHEETAYPADDSDASTPAAHQETRTATTDAASARCRQVAVLSLARPHGESDTSAGFDAHARLIPRA